MTEKTRKILNTSGLLVATVLISVVAAGYFFSTGHQATAQPAPVVIDGEVARPITDVQCGHTYQIDQIKRFRVNGLVVVNFHFGGRDRDRRPQYIADRNIIGQSTEIGRRVNRSLEYSTVTFICLSDPLLEGHKASNIVLLRYGLDLRRPLVPQRVIPEGGPARH